jgi:hypothetical protein
VAIHHHQHITSLHLLHQLTRSSSPPNNMPHGWLAELWHHQIVQRRRPARHHTAVQPKTKQNRIQCKSWCLWSLIKLGRRIDFEFPFLTFWRFELCWLIKWECRKSKQSKAKQERSVLPPPINLLARIKTRRPKTKTKQFGHVPSCDVCHDFFFGFLFCCWPRDQTADH